LLKDAVVDTNVIIAVIIEDDINHREAIRLWGDIQKAFVPTVVMFELAFFLIKYNLDLKLLGQIMTDPKVELVPNNLDDIMFLVSRSSHVTRYDDVGDLSIASVARRLDLELKTFDKSLKKYFGKLRGPT
jgi:uncharacterized protein